MENKRDSHCNPGGRCGPQSRADQPGNKKQGATTLPRKVNIWVPRQLVDISLARNVKIFLQKSNSVNISPPHTEPADRLSSILARARDPRSWPTSARSTWQSFNKNLGKVDLTIYWKFGLKTRPGRAHNWQTNKTFYQNISKVLHLADILRRQSV